MKNFLFASLLAFLCLSLGAKENFFSRNGFDLSLGASLGLLSGQGEEIVYQDNLSEDKLSQLLWNFKPLAYAGLDLEFAWMKPRRIWGFFTAGTFKFGIPSDSGIMEDRDWRGATDLNWLTDYSVHDNTTKEAMLIDADFGASFLIARKFLLKAYMTYSYMRFSWAASGGSGLYPSVHGIFSGDVGTYEQVWHIFSPLAVSFYGSFNDYFDIEIRLALGAAAGFVEDHHFLRDMVISGDLTDGGFFIEPGLEFSFSPRNLFTLSLSVAYRYIKGTRGDQVVDEAGYPRQVAENCYGAAYRAFDAALVAKFAIF